MKERITELDALVDKLEDFEPVTDTQAYCKRELLAALDKAHELLAALAADVDGSEG